MLRRIIAVTLAATLMATPAYAGMKLFPIWERMNCGGQQFACYDFETAKQIFNIDLELQYEMERLEKLERNLYDLDNAYATLEESNEILTLINENLEIRLEEKHAILEENTLALMKSENKSVWNNVHWIATAVVLVSAGAFIGGYYVGNR